MTFCYLFVSLGLFLLVFALFVVRIVLAVGDDDVIQEVDVHQFTGSDKTLGQLIILPARREVA